MVLRCCRGQVRCFLLLRFTVPLINTLYWEFLGLPIETVDISVIDLPQVFGTLHDIL